MLSASEQELSLDFFTVKLLLRALLLPPCGPLLLALLGVMMVRRHPRAGRRTALAGLLLAWICSMGLTADLLAGQVERGLKPLDPASLKAARTEAGAPRAVVVLGGGSMLEGPDKPLRERLHSRTLERVKAGASIARQSGLPVLVSGGVPKRHLLSEAELMRRVMEGDFGVRVRWVEGRSRDTEENARLSRDMLRKERIDSIILVTHAYHMDRSRRAFEAAGFRVIPAPHDWRSKPPDPTELSAWIPSTNAVESVWLATHELIGMAWYRLRGHA